MRQRGTPSNWNPSRQTLRYRHFQVRGLPWLAALAFFPAAFMAYAGLDDGTRFLRYSMLRFQLLPWIIFAVAAAIAAWLAYYVWDRLARDADGFLEIDPVARWLLAVDARGIPGAPRTPEHPTLDARSYMIAFDDITSLSVVSTMQDVVILGRDRRVLAVEKRPIETLVVMPDAAVIYRAAPTGPVRAIAHRLASMTGKPLVELALPQASAMHGVPAR